MIVYKSPEEIEKMKRGGKVLGTLLHELKKFVVPGASANDLEAHAKKYLKKNGAISAFLNYDTGYMGKYPSILCVSINDEVVHGIPSEKKIFKEGDVVGIDCGIWYEGLCTDAAITTSCRDASETDKRLINATREALSIGISKCVPNNYIGDISEAIQKYIESQGFKIIKSLVGHGVGKFLHEDPQVPNFFPFSDKKEAGNKGARIKEGMTLAIEPMVSINSELTITGQDGYAAATSDGSKAAHFEHTVAVLKSNTVILTLP